MRTNCFSLFRNSKLCLVKRYVTFPQKSVRNSKFNTIFKTIYLFSTKNIIIYFFFKSKLWIKVHPIENPLANIKKLMGFIPKNYLTGCKLKCKIR